jgi:CubicO group peptidase (beta-lactamase class C family)
MSFEAVERAMDAAVGRRVFPGAVILVREGTRVFYQRAFGHRSVDPQVTPMEENTVFDLSSLTKPLATSVAIMLMIKDGKISVDDRVTRFFHNFGVYGKTHITFRHLLTHSSGLPAWQPYYKDVLQTERRSGRINFVGSHDAKQFVYQLIQRERLEVPVGSETIYSDIGFMLLGAVVEVVAGTTLDRYCYNRIFRPLGLRATAFIDLAQLRARHLEPVSDMIAPTERCPWRKRVLCGEVHDDNAHAMGGVSGHAGLFGSAKEIDTLIGHLRDCYLGRGDKYLVPPKLMRQFWSRDGTVEGSTWCLGWDTPSPSESSAGSHFSPNSVGHLGFTGTSIWIDLERERHVILLSNRVHPSRNNEAIREFRPYIHDLVVEALQ